MEEISIKFETAKLAQEKGLVHPKKMHTSYYNKHGVYNGDVLDELKIFIKDKSHAVYTVYAPTQSLLQKWLREVHCINIIMCFKPNIKKWDFMPYSMNMNAKEYLNHYSEYYKIHNERRYNTYEEALEAGLIEALKLIKTF